MEEPGRWDPVAALEFLTVLRLRRYRELPVATLARAQAFYPAVGLLIGGLLALVDWGAGAVLPGAARAAVVVAAWAVITGGLHLDGLADSADGLLGGHDPARRLEIMRDPRLGSFGVIALALALLLKWSAVSSLASPYRVAALLATPMLARFAIVVIVAAFPYARGQGLGAGFHTAARRFAVWPAAVFTGIVAVLLLGWGGVALTAVAALCALTVGRWARARIGGVTGDLYGAACELTEVAVLLVVLIAQTWEWLAPWLAPG